MTIYLLLLLELKEVMLCHSDTLFRFDVCCLIYYSLMFCTCPCLFMMQWWCIYIAVIAREMIWRCRCRLFCCLRCWVGGGNAENLWSWFVLFGDPDYSVPMMRWWEKFVDPIAEEIVRWCLKYWCCGDGAERSGRRRPCSILSLLCRYRYDTWPAGIEGGVLPEYNQYGIGTLFIMILTDTTCCCCWENAVFSIWWYIITINVIGYILLLMTTVKVLFGNVNVCYRWPIGSILLLLF